MKLCEINPIFQDRYERFQSFAMQGSLWESEVERLLKEFENDVEDLDALIELMCDSKRIDQIFAAKLENNPDFLMAFSETDMIFWEEYVSPPVDDKLQDALAERLYEEDPKPGDRVAFFLGDGARKVGANMVERAIEDELEFDVMCDTRSMDNANFSRLLVNHANEEGIKGLGAYMLSEYSGLKKICVATPIQSNEKMIVCDQAKYASLLPFQKKISSEVLAGNTHFTLTHIPTEADAVSDGIPYSEYCTLFFEMCDQPWTADVSPRVNIDQAHRKLMEMLDKGRHIHFKNDWGTNIEMDLVDDEGPFTFCNSLVARNVPGSEVFSAPRRDSINGKVVSKGRFAFTPGEVIENLTMYFWNGYLFDFEADKGAEHFQAYLDKDPGNRWVGELGIGSCPHLRRHVLNTLLVEKIAGSFHLALGDAYTMDNYMGDPVRVDNGNRSSTHWDIATMLGDIELDGKIIMKNGKFLDPDLAVLNEGWFAVPEEDRPQYWKDFCARHPGGYDEVAKIQNSWKFQATDSGADKVSFTPAP